MDQEPHVQNKRGRKRLSDEEHLSQEELAKREKNRDAAQRCRQKKEQQTNELKQKNEALEMENKKLAVEKQVLENQALEYKKIISEHYQKGCTIPSALQELWDKELTNNLENEDSHDADGFRVVGILEHDHTPPSSPESASSETTPPPYFHSSVPESSGSFSEGPTALFSGTPLINYQMNRRRSNSSSRSSTSPPAAQTISRLTCMPKDLSHFLTSTKLPEVLAPISMSSIRQKETQQGMAQAKSINTSVITTVVSQIDGHSEDASGYSSNVIDILDAGEADEYTNIHSSQVAALQLPDEPYEDEVSNKTLREYQSTAGGAELLTMPNEQASSQNLLPMGFDMEAVEGYSYSEDLQQLDFQSGSAQYTNVIDQQEFQTLTTPKNRSLSQSENSLMVAVHAIAPALLDIGPEMSQSLQQQIKTSLCSSSSSVAETISVPLTQNNQRVNKQNTVMYQRPDQHIKLIPCQPQLNLFNGQPLASCRQAAQTEITSAKGKQGVTYQSSGILPRSAVNQQTETAVFPPIHQTAKNSQTLQNNQLQKLLRQISSQIPQNRSLFSKVNQVQQGQIVPLPRQTTNMMLIQQGLQYVMQTPQISGVPATSFLIPDLVTSNKGSSTSILASDNTSPEPVLQKTESFTVVSSSDLFTDFTSTATSAQTLNAEASMDYSENVQDLPSLNFGELESDDNLFEKKPSRATS